jgi:hypothetical protein
MTVVPQPGNLMSVIGTELNEQDQLDNRNDSINDIINKIEQFEISYGYQSGGILSFDDNRRYGNNDNDNDEPTQRGNINQNESDDNAESFTDIIENEEEPVETMQDEEFDEEEEEVTIETFRGSQYIKDEEMIIAIKSLCMGLLYILVSHSYLDDYIQVISKYVNVLPIIIKTIIFIIAFYISEKYLL